MKKILVLDNYDSFTYNLVHSIVNITGSKVDVRRNDCILPGEVEKYDKIVLSPGPGLPSAAGIMNELIVRYAQSKSILGVCLGLQAMAEVFGGKLINLNKVYHGVSSKVKITDSDESLFKDLPAEFDAGRYHSWLVSGVDLPTCFKITCQDEEGQIMALSHKKYDLKGVQFHPESVLTPVGDRIIRNWLNS